MAHEDPEIAVDSGPPTSNKPFTHKQNSFFNIDGKACRVEYAEAGADPCLEPGALIDRAVHGGEFRLIPCDD